MHKPYRPLLILSVTSLIAVPLFSTRAVASQGYAARALHTFSSGSIANDGKPDVNALVEASNGSFFGVTVGGGSAGNGILFRRTSSGNYSILHQFGDGSVTNDGTQPQGALVVGPDGDLYGVTRFGGPADLGIAFKIAQDGSNYTILHNFGTGTSPSDGAALVTGLLLGSDGNFYGATYGGGTALFGTVFKMTPAGAVTTLHNFGDGSVANDGIIVECPLTQGLDGTLYGTSDKGGIGNNGTLFKLNTDGSGYTILHRFGDGTVTNDGTHPASSPVVGSDGNLYGAAFDGGFSDGGTLYRITPSGASYATVHNFGDGSIPDDGTNPLSNIFSAPDGSMYGTTQQGGAAGQGTIFKLTGSELYSVVYSFAGNDGTSPSDVILDTDGKFYGMTNGGGSAGFGTIYRVFPANLTVSAPSATAGSAFNATVTARDDSNARITDYSGTIHFTSDDPNAVLPADTFITSGTGTVPVTLYAAAIKNIRVRDNAHSYLTNTATVPVSSAALDHLTLTTPNTVTAGTGFYATLSALDAYNNVVKSLTDTIHLSSTDTTAVLPANFVLTGGAKQIIVKLQMPGTQKITATDTNNSLAVTSGSINVGTVAAKYLITGPATSMVGAVNTYTITAKDNVGNTVTGYTGTVHFTTTDPNAAVPGDITLVNGTGTFQVTFNTKGAQKVNANDTVNAAVKGLASTTVK